MNSGSRKKKDLMEDLKEKALWVRRETVKIHGLAPDTRLASSLSAVEIFTVLYYGGVMQFDPKNLYWERRDRLIVSKGHGAVSLYPILANMGFFDRSELARVCHEGSFLGGIPDTMVPGFETINGSLGHGLGVACGIALALKRKRSHSRVFVLLGDGELYEGAVWEAVMFASQHRLDNLIMIVDNNKICMLGYCKDIIDLTPLENKFKAFKWNVTTVDGHDVIEVYSALKRLREGEGNYPHVLLANTIKGKGVPALENDPLCHVKSLVKEEIICALEGLK